MENEITEWRFLNRTWNNQNIPIPDDITYEVIGSDSRHTIVKVKLNQIGSLIEIMKEREKALEEGIVDPLEKIASDITNTDNSSLDR